MLRNKPDFILKKDYRGAKNRAISRLSAYSEIIFVAVVAVFVQTVGTVSPVGFYLNVNF